MTMSVTRHINELDAMKQYPNELFYKGDISLLERPKVSIVGTRRPISYTKVLVSKLSSALAKRGVAIVSGAAMGVDALAHKAAGSENTIAVMANGLDVRYPAVNKELIRSIEEKGLVLSQFKEGFKATPWSFVVRNEVVVALGDVLIVAQADLKSGSMRSVEFAKKMGKPIYVLPHRIGESDATMQLLKDDEARAIYDIEEFASQFGNDKIFMPQKDSFLSFCAKEPDFDEAVSKFGSKVFEAELEGTIGIKEGRVFLT